MFDHYHQAFYSVICVILLSVSSLQAHTSPTKKSKAKSYAENCLRFASQCALRFAAKWTLCNERWTVAMPFQFSRLAALQLGERVIWTPILAATSAYQIAQPAKSRCSLPIAHHLSVWWGFGFDKGSAYKLVESVFLFSPPKKSHFRSALVPTPKMVCQWIFPKSRTTHGAHASFP